MKTTIKTMRNLLTGFALAMAAGSGMAANVNFNIGLPGIYTEPRPVYIQPEHESDWRERRVRASQWREADHPHGLYVKERAHKHDKHRGKHHGKHNRKHHDKHDD